MKHVLYMYYISGINTFVVNNCANYSFRNVNFTPLIMHQNKPERILLFKITEGIPTTPQLGTCMIYLKKPIFYIEPCTWNDRTIANIENIIPNLSNDKQAYLTECHLFTANKVTL